MTFGTTENTTPASTKSVLTKEERLALIDKQIEALKTKRYNVENDIVVTKAKKEVVLPAVGTDVIFLFGRKTAITSPVEKLGKVIAVKPATEVNGKKLPAQVKVSFGEGFDIEYATIYPAQIVTDAKAAD